MLSSESGRWENLYNFRVEHGFEELEPEHQGGPDPDAEWKKVEMEFECDVADIQKIPSPTRPRRRAG